MVSFPLLRNLNSLVRETEINRSFLFNMANSMGKISTGLYDRSSEEVLLIRGSFEMVTQNAKYKSEDGIKKQRRKVWSLLVRVKIQ